MSESSMRAVQVEQRTTSSPLPNQRTHPLAYVLAGGLIAGTLDILYAYTFWAVKSQIPAQRIFQDVAAGLLGEASFQGGWSTAALGLALHFLIAITTAAVYYLVALRWPLLWRQPLLSGTIYGLLVYGVMNYIVLPISAAGSGSKDPLWIGLSILVHMFLIGVPCAVFARRAVLARQFASRARCETSALREDNRDEIRQSASGNLNVSKAEAESYTRGFVHRGESQIREQKVIRGYAG